MVKLLLVLAAYALLPVSYTFSQNVGIGTSTPNSSSLLDITGTNKGLLLPRMTTSGITSIPNPAKGLMVYDSVKNQLMVNMGTSLVPNWQTITQQSGWSLSGNSSLNPATHFIGTTDSVSLIFKIHNKPAGRVDVNSGARNTFFGLEAGSVNSIGVDNTATGSSALRSNTSGSNNTAAGSEALRSNSTGGNNTAIGGGALHFNTIGNQNTSAGSFALYSNTTGSGNMAAGSAALYSNTTGNYNTAAGSAALYSNTAGNFNTATGNEALSYNTTGSNNTGTGNAALSSNTTGSNNTATGASALQVNTDGFENTANGYFALQRNTTGGGNTAIGSLALNTNTTGNYNTAIGSPSLYSNTTGLYNTSVGSFSLGSNNNSYNTGVGFNALLSTTNSQYNTAIGYFAGFVYNNGYNNVFVGANTDVNGNGYFNVIAMGQGTVVGGSSVARFGNAATGSYGGWAGWTNLSDGRFKTDIKENVPGIDFILKLRPVTYKMQATAVDAFLHRNRKVEMSEEGKMWHQKALQEKEKITYTGFMAQEVEKAARELGFDFSGIDAARNEKDTYGLRYAEFVVPLVKAVQEQQTIIKKLEMQVEAVKAEIPMEIGKQQAIIEKQQKQIEDLLKRLEAVEKKTN